jgi:hypothetical protein
VSVRVCGARLIRLIDGIKIPQLTPATNYLKYIAKTTTRTTAVVAILNLISFS